MNAFLMKYGCDPNRKPSRTLPGPAAPFSHSAIKKDLVMGLTGMRLFYH